MAGTRIPVAVTISRATGEMTWEYSNQCTPAQEKAFAHFMLGTLGHVEPTKEDHHEKLVREDHRHRQAERLHGL